MSYTAQLNPWAPPAVIPVLAWLGTAAETVLGIALVVGFLPRWAGLLSGIVLLLRGDGREVGTRVFGVLGLCRRVRLVREPISPLKRGRRERKTG